MVRNNFKLWTSLKHSAVGPVLPYNRQVEETVTRLKLKGPFFYLKPYRSVKLCVCSDLKNHSSASWTVAKWFCVGIVIRSPTVYCLYLQNNRHCRKKTNAAYQLYFDNIVPALGEASAVHTSLALRDVTE